MRGRHDGPLLAHHATDQGVHPDQEEELGEVGPDAEADRSCRPSPVHTLQGRVLSLFVEFDPVSVTDALARLRRAEGQVAGVVRMIGEGRDCADVIQQLAAARRALDRAGMKLLASGLESCIAERRARGVESGVPEEFERLFMSLT